MFFDNRHFSEIEFTCTREKTLRQLIKTQVSLKNLLDFSLWAKQLGFPKLHFISRFYSTLHLSLLTAKIWNSSRHYVIEDVVRSFVGLLKCNSGFFQKINLHICSRKFSSLVKVNTDKFSLKIIAGILFIEINYLGTRYLLC